MITDLSNESFNSESNSSIKLIEMIDTSIGRNFTIDLVSNLGNKLEQLNSLCSEIEENLPKNMSDGEWLNFPIIPTTEAIKLLNYAFSRNCFIETLYFVGSLASYANINDILNQNISVNKIVIKGEELGKELDSIINTLNRKEKIARSQLLNLVDCNRNRTDEEVFKVFFELISRKFHTQIEIMIQEGNLECLEFFNNLDQVKEISCEYNEAREKNLAAQNRITAWNKECNFYVNKTKKLAPNSESIIRSADRIAAENSEVSKSDLQKLKKQEAKLDVHCKESSRRTIKFFRDQLKHGHGIQQNSERLFISIMMGCLNDFHVEQFNVNFKTLKIFLSGNKQGYPTLTTDQPLMPEVSLINDIDYTLYPLLIAARNNQLVLFRHFLRMKADPFCIIHGGPFMNKTIVQIILEFEDKEMRLCYIKEIFDDLKIRCLEEVNKSKKVATQYEDYALMTKIKDQLDDFIDRIYHDINMDVNTSGILNFFNLFSSKNYPQLFVNYYLALHDILEQDSFTKDELEKKLLEIENVGWFGKYSELYKNIRPMLAEIKTHKTVIGHERYELQTHYAIRREWRLRSIENLDRAKEANRTNQKFSEIHAQLAQKDEAYKKRDELNKKKVTLLSVALAEKDAKLAEKDAALAEKDAELARYRAKESQAGSVDLYQGKASATKNVTVINDKFGDENPTKFCIIS